MWEIYMDRYTGKIHSGPFAKLLDLFQQIGWSLQRVPFFLDHDGFRHNLLELPNRGLESLLFDAWMQRTSHAVRHRKTMADLHGMDPDLAFFDRSDHTAGDLGRILALQAGAFVSTAQHSKFDLTKQPLCKHCHVPATQRHWFDCPMMAHHRADAPGLGDWINDVPDCLLLHLLVPRNPFYGNMKQYLLQLADCSNFFWSAPGTGVQHLFSDGSFFTKKPQIASVAAWSVVNATTGYITGCGHPPGLVQSSPRAELCGVIAAALWCCHFRVETFLWCDSAFTVKGVKSLLEGTRWTGKQAADHDLWDSLAQILEEIPTGLFRIEWIPSHLDMGRCDDDFEDWISTWNEVADSIAVQMNLTRGTQFEQMDAELQGYFQSNLNRLRALKTFYLKIVDDEGQDDEVIDLTGDDMQLVASLPDQLSLSDGLAVNWNAQLKVAFEETRYPVQFAISIFEAVCHLETESQISFTVSFIELAIWLVTDMHVLLPFWDSSSGGWKLCDYFAVLLRPTVASIVSQIRQVLVQGLKHMNLAHFLRKGVSRLDSGISIPVDGVEIRTTLEFASRLKTLTLEFSGSRMIRKAADLARPL